MLTYIHHPAGPVVIRTTNPFITLTYQDSGWLTTTSLSDVLRDHPEWQSVPAPPTSTPINEPKESILTRLGAAILSSLSATMAMLPSYAPTGVGSMAPIIVWSGRDRAERRERRELAGSSAPIRWMTAVEQSWYQDRGLPVPIIGWHKCNQGDGTFKYRLVEGELNINVPPEYDAHNEV